MKESETIAIVCTALQLSRDTTQFERFHRAFNKAVEALKAEILQDEAKLTPATLGAGLLLCTLSV